MIILPKNKSLTSMCNLCKDRSSLFIRKVKRNANNYSKAKQEKQAKSMKKDLWTV